MLISDLQRLASQQPELRKHLVPLIRKYGSQCVSIPSGERAQYEEAIWEMFNLTYSGMGRILSSSKDLYEYDLWGVCFKEGRPISFSLSKKTSFGVKGGLSGSDGSPEGKRSVIETIRSLYRPGFYGEVSHKLEEISVAAGAPAVCAVHVPLILGKDVIPEPDGVHYRRHLKGVGMVTKILLGYPKGIPTTDPKNPSCGRAAFSHKRVESSDPSDVLTHYACLSIKD